MRDKATSPLHKEAWLLLAIKAVSTPSSELLSGNANSATSKASIWTSAGKDTDTNVLSFMLLVVSGPGSRVWVKSYCQDNGAARPSAQQKGNVWGC